MNLFASSADPQEAAQHLDDKRLNKILTESAQILCTILRDDGVKNLPFKSTHESHPVVQWAAETDANLYWTSRYHIALVQEWLYRGGKPHASALPEKVLTHIRPAKAPKTFQNSARNKLRGLDFTWCDDVHLAYRMYLTARWMNDTYLPSWKNRCSPDFLDEIPEAMFIYIRGSIRKNLGPSIPCPRCGGSFEFKSRDDFRCVEKHPWYPCLLWKEIKR